MIQITDEDFDVNVVIQGLKNEDVGAIVSFIGIVRDFTERRNEEMVKKRAKVKQLIYESYSDMATKKMTQIKNNALVNYNIKDMQIIHRIGVLKPSDKIVLIAVSAAHRKEAFEACQYAIDEIKKIVPIWKKEVTSKEEYWVGEESREEKND